MILWLALSAATSTIAFALLLHLSGGAVVPDHTSTTIAIMASDIVIALAAIVRPAGLTALVGRAGPWLLGLAIIGAAAGWTLYDTVLMRRFLFTNATLFALTPAIRPLRAFLSGPGDRLPRQLLVLLIIVLIVPGFVWPPFWDGIPGWKTGPVSIGETATLQGHQLIRDDGRSIWYSPAILGTVTYFEAWERLSLQSEAKHRAFAEFLLSRYRRNFPLVSRGLSANEWLLGRFAFPSHKPRHILAYDDFPPERITALAYVRETYDTRTGKLLTRSVSHRYDVPR